LVLLGSFLPWYSVFGVSISSWDVPVMFLVSASESGTGLKVGLLLLVAAAFGLPYATKQPLPNWVRPAVAGIAGAATGLAIVRGFADDSAGLSLGIFVTLVGAGLIGYEALKERNG
ncbi:MAG: hypothetical protein LC808_27430, partial [Actinobacteria bacterium]|nr:hypothetical protein [Actinomycetota bacterium]